MQILIMGECKKKSLEHYNSKSVGKLRDFLVLSYKVLVLGYLTKSFFAYVKVVQMDLEWSTRDGVI